jgi:hypothetical protein
VALLAFLAKIGTVVFVAYRFRTGSGFTLRGAATYLLAIAGLLALFDGGPLAVLEEARVRYGRVVPGVVIEKLSSTGTDGSGEIGRRSRRYNRARRIVTITGFRLHEILARWVVTGSPAAWVISYRFPCAAPRGCYERDFVTKEQWDGLREGQSVNVRHADGETLAGRLDEYPQWPIAIAVLAIGSMLLPLAKLLWSGFALFAGQTWITSPAVVVAVETVRYSDDAIRWRVRFAYFDPQGVAQESADEVAVASWKVGDPCVAVFQPDQPELATLQPATAT